MLKLKWWEHDNLKKNVENNWDKDLKIFCFRIGITLTIIHIWHSNILNEFYTWILLSWKIWGEQPIVIIAQVDDPDRDEDAQNLFQRGKEIVGKILDSTIETSKSNGLRIAIVITSFHRIRSGFYRLRFHRRVRRSRRNHQTTT